MNEGMVAAFILAGVFSLFLGVMFFIFGDDWKTKILGTLVCMLISFAITGCACLNAYQKAQEWNGGFCECGGVWELRGVTKSHANSSVTRYYVCPECHTEISQ